MRLVVEAVLKEAYAVDEEYVEVRRALKTFAPLQVLESPKSVEEAAVPLEVSTQTTPDGDVLRVPAVVVESVRKPVWRLVEDAVMNEEYAVDEE
jgi:hypothetical protein